MGEPAQAKTERDAPIADAFDIIAWEIELAGARCIQLDSLVGAIVDQLPAENKASVFEGLHAVDLLSQHLTGLSAFARALSGSVPAGLRAPVDGALAQVTLGALADRMAGALGAAQKGLGDGDDAGDLDLF